MRTRPALLALPLLAGVSSCGGGGGSVDGSPTFARDVAPIVFARCAACHRTGEAAPFPLLSFADVEKRARQIADVVESGFMPPWLPDSTRNTFEGDRSLTADEIDTLLRWVAAGASEGDPDEAPPAPTFSPGWEAGEPDVVARMPAAFTLPAEGRDLYRNFVVPVSVTGTRWVRATEFRPDNRAVVHHAVLFVDRSGISRTLDAQDPEPGYPGMSPGPGARVPDGQFVGWAPGKVVRPGSEEIAWKVDGRTDLILQLHLRPTGRPEAVRVALGLHLSERPPTLEPVAIRLMSRDIDIPAGEADYLVADDYVTPVDLQVLAVYPHAHYLATELSGYATLPDGTRQWLVHIPAWDFNWQDEYHYEKPLFLPRGSTISLRYRFDNSAQNPLNPHDPPRRVLHGEQSDDEMAELLLQVLPAAADLPILWRDFARKVLAEDLAYLERRSAAAPDEPRWHALVAQALLKARRSAEAVAHLERLVELRPERVNPLYELGHARLADGDARGAARDLAATLAREPRHLRALVDLGRAYWILNELDEARQVLTRAVELAPTSAQARTTLGEVLAAMGAVAEAQEQFQRALEADPEAAAAWLGLARLAYRAQRLEETAAHCRAALRVYPDEAAAHHLLGLALEADGEAAQALVHFELAHRLEPGRRDFEADLLRAREGTR